MLSLQGTRLKNIINMERTMPSTSRVLPLRHTGYGERLREIECGCLKNVTANF
jgi:hypothetical protein